MRRVRLGLKLLLFLGVAYFALVAVVPELRRAAGELQNLNPLYIVAGLGLEIAALYAYSLLTRATLGAGFTKQALPAHKAGTAKRNTCQIG